MIFAAALLAVSAGVRAEDHPLELAVAALNANDFSAAVEHLEAALAEDEDHLEARFNLAFAHTQLGQREQAIEQYQKVLALKADLPQARANLGILLLEADRPAEAAEQFRALVALRPEEADPQSFLAHALSRSGAFEEAIPAYERLLELDPNRADAHLGLGRARARTGDLESAVPSYLKAAELDPEKASAVLEIAETLERAGETSRAVELYTAYSEAHPEDAAVLERIGFLLLDSDRGEEAIALLERVVRDSPTVANRVALGEAYGRAGQTEKAFTLWAEAAAADPSAVDVRMRLATALLKADRCVQAGPHFIAVTKLAPTRADAWNGLALCLYKVDNFPAALDALIESARHEPPQPGNLFLRAVVEDKLQLFEEAKASYEAFLAAEPDLEDEVWKAEQRLKTVNKILERR